MTFENEPPADKRALRFYYACLKYAAKSSTNEQDAEDFGAWAYIHGQPYFKRPIKFLFIDFLRERSGRAGSSQFEARKELYSTPDYDLSRVAACDADPASDLDFSNMTNLFKGENRAILKLRYAWGFSEKEIGDCFGLSEGRISQKLKAIQEVLPIRMASKKQSEAEAICQALQDKETESLQRRFGLSCNATVEVARLRCKKEGGGSPLGGRSISTMAERESEEMATDYETSFDEWLT